MTKTLTKTPAKYIASLSPDHRATLKVIRAILRQHKNLREEMAINPSGDIIMYVENGNYVFGVSDHRDGVSLYALRLNVIRSVLKAYGPKFGKQRFGVYCFRFRTADEIDQPLLKKFVREIVKVSAVA